MKSSSAADDEFGNFTGKNRSKKHYRSARTGNQTALGGNMNLAVNPMCNRLIQNPNPCIIKDRSSGFWKMVNLLPMLIETRIGLSEELNVEEDQLVPLFLEFRNHCVSLVTDYELQQSFGLIDNSSEQVCSNSNSERLTNKISKDLVCLTLGPQMTCRLDDICYGLFGSAFITNSAIGLYSLKPYDFMVTDYWARRNLDCNRIIELYGNEMYRSIKSSEQSVVEAGVIRSKNVVDRLKERSHAFLIQIGKGAFVESSWIELYGDDRVVVIDRISQLPYVQALIIGLTEGSLKLSSAADFLNHCGLGVQESIDLVKAVSGVQIKGQARLREKMTRQLPQIGDLFGSSSEIWPIINDSVDKTEVSFDVL